MREVLAATPGSQILTVVGLNRARLDFDDLALDKGYSAARALARWQWGMQVCVKEHNRRGAVPMNVYMPGLVKTKILANEPQPMRTVARLMTALIGITPAKAAENVASVIEDVRTKNTRSTCYAWAKRREELDLKMAVGDQERLWSLTEEQLRPYL